MRAALLWSSRCWVREAPLHLCTAVLPDTLGTPVRLHQPGLLSPLLPARPTVRLYARQFQHSRERQPFCMLVQSNVPCLWSCLWMADCLLPARWHAKLTQLPAGPESWVREVHKSRQIHPQNEDSTAHTPTQTFELLSGRIVDKLAACLGYPLNLLGSVAAFRGSANMPSLLSGSLLGCTCPQYLTQLPSLRSISQIGTERNIYWKRNISSAYKITIVTFIGGVHSRSVPRSTSSNSIGIDPCTDILY